MSDILQKLSRPGPERGIEVWELFNANSRVTSAGPRLDLAAEPARLGALHETLPHELWAETPLPPGADALRGISSLSVGEAVLGRTSPRAGLTPTSTSMDTLSGLLFAAAGVTHDETAAGYPRPFRATPSGGGLYPLEVFALVNRVDGMAPGLYHYDPTSHVLRGNPDGQAAERLANTFVQPDYVQNAAIVFLLTALFERATVKYGARGYRFTLLEAGHMAQNINLAAVGAGLAAQNLGGFLDDRLDREMDFDGLLQSTVYCVAVGAAA